MGKCSHIALSVTPKEGRSQESWVLCKWRTGNLQPNRPASPTRPPPFALSAAPRTWRRKTNARISLSDQEARTLPRSDMPLKSRCQIPMASKPALSLAGKASRRARSDDVTRWAVLCSFPGDLFLGLLRHRSSVFLVLYVARYKHLQHFTKYLKSIFT